MYDSPYSWHGRCSTSSPHLGVDWRQAVHVRRQLCEPGRFDGQNVPHLVPGRNEEVKAAAVGPGLLTGGRSRARRSGGLQPVGPSARLSVRAGCQSHPCCNEPSHSPSRVVLLCRVEAHPLRPAPEQHAAVVYAQLGGRRLAAGGPHEAVHRCTGIVLVCEWGGLQGPTIRVSIQPNLGWACTGHQHGGQALSQTSAGPAAQGWQPREPSS